MATKGKAKAPTAPLQPLASGAGADPRPRTGRPGDAPAAPHAVDLAERWILFLDTLRQRAENMIEHERQGMPPLLDFKYETILDARRFERPANYALLRITEIGDDCWQDCLDEKKPPVIVVDPRAGHGPGIGGFKRDSEVGMAMHEGHPVYFVIFFPEPMPGQTLADVHHALRRFVAEVARRHPDTPPVLYGNCQAGWAVTLLAADCQGLSGPVVLNGSPLSYWAGDPTGNTMRMLGGLSGGTWAAHLVADLGDGRFDGAWLAQNFENLQPEKAIWEKYAHLFTHIDDERERFLEFERWWNGFYFLSREEILAITENLFIGNRLETGEMRICDHCAADLRRIDNPIVIFASEGDNITPPAQALGWIPKVYPDTAALKAAGQRIVYLINPHVGHLGIFVSASVARLEHRAILESLDEIEALAPGLYEMKIDNPSGDPDCHKPAFTVRFEERDVADLADSHPTEALAARRPDLPQIACFDTAFHHSLPRLARMTGLPREMETPQLRRYGYHGLSYGNIVSAIARDGVDVTAERIIVAHLGNGASLAAVRNGRSVETTMGFSTISGVPMGTRSGDIDPGLILHLQTEHGMTAAQLEDLLTSRS